MCSGRSGRDVTVPGSRPLPAPEEELDQIGGRSSTVPLLRCSFTGQKKSCSPQRRDPVRIGSVDPTRRGPGPDRSSFSSSVLVFKKKEEKKVVKSSDAS
ncbi:Hypothetical protein SMAX5B_016175 [Scophthalmus maximus]|uniref:Uncharacterized protein n=1 Tax=Scophthalmus maximus TaxID=52904 RepID=A0A2U9CAU7_SCOMX|nr:Hypothetical protein SMAX5B_016175 [Scophthalmus maximus]